MAKQKSLVEALESVQESSRVRVRVPEQFVTAFFRQSSKLNYILHAVDCYELNTNPFFVQKRMFCS
jgi:hypothetical protein